MIKLSDRLQLIANLIKRGETMADIGTDHGFLPLYLLENGVSPKAVMCDISEPSLEKAVEASDKYGITEGAFFRAGDGLDVLENGEVDDIVIAGMGGVLITDILGKDPAKSKSFGRYILQPRNNAALLRHWLAGNGFEIEENHIVREGKFICEIITAIPQKTSQNGEMAPSETIEDEIDPRWELPDDVICSDKELLNDFIELKIRQERKKLDGLKKGKTTDACKIAESQKRLDYFRRYQNDRI